MISIVVVTYNRLPSLKRCIESVRENTSCPYQLIVVENACTDGTVEYLNKLCDESDYEKFAFTWSHREENEGMGASNVGFELSRYPIILRMDDDAFVHKDWDKVVLKEFEDPKLGMCGVQGGLIHEWMIDSVFESNNGYVDFITGFFMAFRRVGLYCDPKLGKFWTEDTDLSFQFKNAGYKLKVIPMVCTHASQRNSPIDWSLHDGNRKYVKEKWQDKLESLRLGGN